MEDPFTLEGASQVRSSRSDYVDHAGGHVLRRGLRERSLQRIFGKHGHAKGQPETKVAEQQRTRYVGWVCVGYVLYIVVCKQHGGGGHGWVMRDLDACSSQLSQKENLLIRTHVPHPVPFSPYPSSFLPPRTLHVPSPPSRPSFDPPSSFLPHRSSSLLPHRPAFPSLFLHPPSSFSVDFARHLVAPRL